MPTKKKVPAKKAAVAAPEFSAAKTGKSAPKKNAKTKTATNKNKTAPAKKAASKAPATKGKGKGKTAAPVSKARGGQNLPRVMNEHGFVVGSESEKIVNVLLEGGAGRQEVNQKVLKALGNKQTANGQAPNVSSLIANILKRLKEKGYTVEAKWQLHPPTPASKAAATRAAKKAGTAPAKKAAPVKKAVAKKTATAKKAPAKRASGKAASKG